MCKFKLRLLCVVHLFSSQAYYSVKDVMEHSNTLYRVPGTPDSTNIYNMIKGR